MNNIYGIADSANILIRKKSDLKPFLFADYATQSVNEWKNSSIYAMSKSVRAIRFDYGKESTLKMSLEIFDLKWIAMLSGSDFVTGVTSTLQREVLTSSVTNTITITGTPKVGSLSIFTLDTDNITHLKEQIVGLPATTVDTYSILANVATLNATTAPSGAQLVAYYMQDSAVTSQTLEIKANAFPYAVDIFCDTKIRDTDGIDKYVQVHYLNARPAGNFTLNMSATSITKFEITFDLLKDSKSDDMATYTIL